MRKFGLFFFNYKLLLFFKLEILLKKIGTRGKTQENPLSLRQKMLGKISVIIEWGREEKWVINEHTHIQTNILHSNALRWPRKFSLKKSKAFLRKIHSPHFSLLSCLFFPLSYTFLLCISIIFFIIL